MFPKRKIKLTIGYDGTECPLGYRTMRGVQRGPVI